MSNLLSKIALVMIARAEKKIGVTFDYIRHIAKTDFGLLMRYNKLFSIIDPRKHAPADAYHAARIRAALAADCGTCVEAELNLAAHSKLSVQLIHDILGGSAQDPNLQAVIDFADATVRDRIDASEQRDIIREAYGDKGLIEIAIAMNGAAMLPGVKRALGYASACDVDLMMRSKK